MEDNIQCKAILEGIEKLELYLQDKIVSESLELNSNADTTKYKTLLSRLKKSLVQYTRPIHKLN